MGHIRSLKPEFWRSRSLAKCSINATLTFQGMWTEADDHGRGIASAAILHGAIWPLRPEVTEEDVESHIQELASGQPTDRHIRLYWVDGDRYYEVIHWDEHQAAVYRRGKPIYPPPPSDQVQQSESDCNNLSTRAGSREQGAGSREQGAGKAAKAAADSSPNFEELWSAYPNKAAKPDAIRAFRNARAPFDEIMAGLRAWCVYWAAEGTPKQFIPYPQKFLHQRKWQDEPPAVNVAHRARAPDSGVSPAVIEYRARKGLSSTNGAQT